MQAAARDVPVGESDTSARTCVTSGWRSQWPLPSPHSARRWQGPGERHQMQRLSPKGGFCGMLWDIFPCLHLMFLCRRWWISCPTLKQVIEVPKILPFDVPMRTAVRVPQLAEQLVEVPTIISYSSFQRTVEHHVDIPVPGGGGSISGLQGFSSGQSSTATPSSKKRISERIVEPIVDPGSSGRLHGSLPGQGSSSSHSPAGVEKRADDPGEGFLRTFPQNKRSAKVAPHSGSELPPHSSSWTPAAQLEVSVEWVRLRERHAGKSYFWNRRTNSTVWQAPAGVEVVWYGERDEEGEVYYWHRDTRVSTFDLPPLPLG